MDGEIIRKGSNGEDGYSGFTMRDPITEAEIPTPLEAMLRERGIDRVVICGLATDYCVNATALDARRLGFETVVLTRAVAAVNLKPGDEERAIRAMAERRRSAPGGLAHLARDGRRPRSQAQAGRQHARLR